MARGPFIITMVAEPLVAANGELFGGKTLDREFRGWEEDAIRRKEIELNALKSDYERTIEKRRLKWQN